MLVVLALALCCVLGTCQAAPTVDRLLSDFGAVDWDVRAKARPKDPADAAWRVRVETAESLVALGAAAIPELVTALASPNRHVRALASFCLGAIGDATAREPLSALLAQDGDPVVRLYAGQALGWLGDPAAIPAVESAVRENEGYVRQMARMSLQRLQQGVPLDPILRMPLPPDTGFSSPSPPAVGTPAPDFTLLNDKGETVKLSDYRGKQPVVVVFALANW